MRQQGQDLKVSLKAPQLFSFCHKCVTTFSNHWTHKPCLLWTLCCAVLPHDSFSHSYATAFAVKSSSNDSWVFFLIGTKGGDLWSWWWSGSRNPSTFFTGKWGARLYQQRLARTYPMIISPHACPLSAAVWKVWDSKTTQAQTNVLIKISEFIVWKRCKFYVECHILRIVPFSSQPGWF